MINKILIKSAIEGNAESCYLLAEKYFNGNGTQKDREIAKQWYEAAAKKGHTAAQYMYGYLLCVSARNEKELIKGVKYIKQSAKKSHTAAMLLLARNYFYGVGVKKSEKKAFKTWKKASVAGCPEAQYYIGLCYDKGIYVKRNVLKAKRYLFGALENGYTESVNVLKSVYTQNVNILRSGYPVAA